MNDFKDGQTSLKMESEYKSIQYSVYNRNISVIGGITGYLNEQICLIKK